MKRQAHTILILSLLTIGCRCSINAQEVIFKALNPLEITPSLSGNYGELRPNHFHAGLDLKTGGKIGLPVHAVAFGYVSRIKISPYGYGKAIYITHPNGYTTVYSHLNSWSDSIKNYVRRIQYEQQSFSIDVYPGSSDLRIKENQVIAYSGNTGGSGGPHVHFEVRETDSEVPRNPLLFNFPLSDSKKPIIEAVGIAPLSSDSKVQNRSMTQHFRASSGGINGNNVSLVTGVFGVEMSGFDQQDGAVNRNGIYQVRCFIDEELTSIFTADSIPFDQSRYMNALIDYEHYYRTRQRFLRLYRLPGNALENIRYKQDGNLDLTEGRHSIRIEASDCSGNLSNVKFQIDYRKTENKVDDNTEQVKWNSDYFYESQQYRIHIPKRTIYSNEELKVTENENSIEILRHQVPVHKPFQIKIYAPDENDGDLIGLLNSKGNISRVLVTRREGQWLSAESKSFGKFGITTDQTAPVIRLGNFRNEMNVTSQNLTFDIKDNLSGIEDYSVFINDSWVLAHYEYKQNLLFIEPEEISNSKEQQQLLLEVRDMAGNVATFEGTFFKR
jgi:murein DD-endopeptidase MepM/ murein hydrolase activator NlpD